MNPSYNTVNKQIKNALTENDLNMQYRHSFAALDQSRVVGYNTKKEDYGSTSSECTSTGAATRLMSTTESTTEDVSFSLPTDSTISWSTHYSYQMSEMWNGGAKLYQPLICDQQHQIQLGYSFPRTEMGVFSYGYLPIQIQPMPMGLQFSQQLQPQQLYSMRQNHLWPQDLGCVAMSSDAVTRIFGTISQPEQGNLNSQLGSYRLVSSTVSAPALNCLSATGYANMNGHLKTLVLSSASCTPIQSSSAYPGLPPMLDLNNSLQGRPFPHFISCNNNMDQPPLNGGDVSAVDKYLSTTSRDSLVNQQETPELPFSNNEQSEKIESAPEGKVEENLWIGTCKYIEYQDNGGSNLFITWSGSKAKLIEKLQHFKFGVRNVYSTNDEIVYNVIFESHPIARKAFTMQREVRLRAVPPKNSRRVWFRNPSPKFLVKFQTKRKLAVRKGRAECHDIVGWLLKGSLISADQLKGYCIRIVLCEGSFKFPGGKIVEMKGVPNEFNNKRTLGWMSYRCKYTKELHVIRRSSNTLSDYLYVE